MFALKFFERNFGETKSLITEGDGAEGNAEGAEKVQEQEEEENVEKINDAEELVGTETGEVANPFANNSNMSA